MKNQVSVGQEVVFSSSDGERLDAIVKSIRTIPYNPRRPAHKYRAPGRWADLQPVSNMADPVSVNLDNPNVQITPK